MNVSLILKLARKQDAAACYVTIATKGVRCICRHTLTLTLHAGR